MRVVVVAGSSATASEELSVTSRWRCPGAVLWHAAYTPTVLCRTTGAARAALGHPWTSLHEEISSQPLYLMTSYSHPAALTQGLWP